MAGVHGMSNVRNDSDDGSDSNSDSSENTVEDSSDSDIEDTDTIPMWSKSTFGLCEFSFTKDSGLLADSVPGNNRPIDWFLLLLDDIFFEEICRYTNNYALQLFCGPNTSNNSRITRWKDITVEELKTFLGLLIHTGTIRLNRLQDYWKTTRFFNIPIFRDYMSRDRFLIIMRCLYFSKPDEETDRMNKIQRVVDYFNNKMAAIYYPSRELSLDEAMILWRGRLVFRQYIKGKRHKYGIKLYSLTEPHGLTYKFCIYGGKESPIAGKDHASKVVFHLMEGLLRNGHSVFMDNYYNSFSLTSKLLSKKTYCTGTLRANRKHNPENVKGAVLKKGETIAEYADGVMVGKWKDKRVVFYISNEYQNEMCTVLNKRKQERVKPLPIIKYNANMKGVDRSDQMLSYYPCERKTLRWYKKIFIHVLQMVVINSFMLHNMYNFNEKKSLYDFRLAILEHLLPTKQQLPVRTPPRNLLHTLVKNEERDNNGDRKRKQCRICYKDQKKRKMTTFTCSTCPDKPGLCAVDCFDKYHKSL